MTSVSTVLTSTDLARLAPLDWKMRTTILVSTSSWLLLGISPSEPMEITEIPKS